MLDIIVPHYTEPWEVGRKFFDMLDMQRGVDFSLIRVLVIHDGEENALPDTCFSGRPYRAEQSAIPHAGVSAARNAGLERAEAPWVMFCDFDDMFAHPYALRDILNVLPAPGFDMLWGDLLIEYLQPGGGVKVVRDGKLNSVFCHAKLYRRQYLLDNGFRFDETLIYHEDSEFNGILLAKTDPKRIGKIDAQLPTYIWCCRKDSVSNQPGIWEANMTGLYRRDKKVCEAYGQGANRRKYRICVASVVWKAYYVLNAPALSPELEEMRRDFIGWYADHEAVFLETDEKDIPAIKTVAKAECGRRDNRENVSIEQWLYEIKNQPAAL